MSHFAEVKVDFKAKNETQLVEALKKVFGAKHVKHSIDGGLKVRNFAGKILNQQEQNAYGKVSGDCHIVVDREAIIQWNNQNGFYGYESDVGFERQEDGTYKVYADNTGSFHKKELKNKVLQEYTCLVTEKQMKLQGYAVARKVNSKTGSIQLIASKYA